MICQKYIHHCYRMRAKPPPTSHSVCKTLHLFSRFFIFSMIILWCFLFDLQLTNKAVKISLPGFYFLTHSPWIVIHNLASLLSFRIGKRKKLQNENLKISNQANEINFSNHIKGKSPIYLATLPDLRLILISLLIFLFSGEYYSKFICVCQGTTILHFCPMKNARKFLLIMLDSCNKLIDINIKLRSQLLLLIASSLQINDIFNKIAVRSFRYLSLY